MTDLLTITGGLLIAVVTGHALGRWVRARIIPDPIDEYARQQERVRKVLGR